MQPSFFWLKCCTVTTMTRKLWIHGPMCLWARACTAKESPETDSQHARHHDMNTDTVSQKSRQYQVLQCHFGNDQTKCFNKRGDMYVYIFKYICVYIYILYTHTHTLGKHISHISTQGIHLHLAENSPCRHTLARKKTAGGQRWDVRCWPSQR